MKKLISILTTLVLALQLTTAYAAGTPTVSLSKGEGFAGDNVDLVLSLDNVDYWTNVWVEIEYDNTALKLTRPAISSAQGLDAYGDNTISFTTMNSQKPMDVPYHYGWLSATASCTYTGAMATYKFQILPTAQPGVYPITVKAYKGVNKDFVDGVDCNFWEDVDVEYTYEKSSLNLTYVDGAITVKSVGPTEPKLTAEKTAEGVAIAAESPEAITGKFIVAGYDANGLVDVEVINAAATATASVDGDTIKVMWWDSIDGMTSIAPAVTL